MRYLPGLSVLLGAAVIAFSAPPIAVGLLAFGLWLIYLGS